MIIYCMNTGTAEWLITNDAKRKELLIIHTHF